jgi:hypothetical protein
MPGRVVGIPPRKIVFSVPIHWLTPITLARDRYDAAFETVEAIVNAVFI